MIIGLLYVLVFDTGVFDSKPIDKKFGYYYNPNDTIKYLNPILVYNEDDINNLIKYYNLLFSNKFDSASLLKKEFGLINTKIFRIPKKERIDIIEYKNGYAFVRIKYKVNYRPYEIIEKGYIPNSLLHDTLVTCIQEPIDLLW